jgi:hypothetical protein
MELQDQRGSLTPEQLRQRYKLDDLGKDRKAIQANIEGLTKINNEQESIVESIILSLADIEIQSAITLWFFNGEPTVLNAPYTYWPDPEDKEEHLGDLYYDRDKGYVYQFQLNDTVFSWIRRYEKDLIQAMALTNASIDTQDSYRNVFLDTPTLPINVGDWWIKSNGLFIAQVDKTEGALKDNDFIIATKYVVGTQASEMNNKIIVVAGQVTTIINDVKSINEQIEDNRYYIDQEGNQHLISSEVYNLKRSVEGIDLKISRVGGNNLLPNCVKQFGNKGYTGTFPNYTNPEDIQKNSLSKSGIMFLNGIDGTSKDVPNGSYNFSFKYKKYLSLAVCTIKVNNQLIALTSTEWEEKDISIEVTSNKIEIEYVGDTDNSCIIVDVMLNIGSEKQSYSQNPNEIDEEGTEIGGGRLRLWQSDSDVQFIADNDDLGFQQRSTGNMITSFSDKGMNTNELTANKAVIAGISFSKSGNHKRISAL